MKRITFCMILMLFLHASLFSVFARFSEEGFVRYAPIRGETVISDFPRAVVPMTYILLGTNRGLGFDEETRHSYIILENPTLIVMESQNKPWKRYSSLLEDNNLRVEKKIFYRTTMLVDYSCDNNVFYATECDAYKWQHPVEQSVGKDVALWIKWEYMQQYPLDFFLFSRFVSTSIDMTHYNESIRSDRKLLLQSDPFAFQKRIILKIPANIGVIESFVCKSSEYPYSYKRLYEFYSPYAGYQAGYMHGDKWDWYHANPPWNEGKWNQFVNEVFVSVGVCEEQEKTRNINRILQRFFFKK